MQPNGTGQVCSSGRARAFAIRASCNAVPAYRPARRLGCPALVSGDTIVVSPPP